MTTSRRISDLNSMNRNQLRNLKSFIINSAYPGSQRNSTTRDALALNESTDFGGAVNFDDAGLGATVGTATAGE